MILFGASNDLRNVHLETDGGVAMDRNGDYAKIWFSSRPVFNNAFYVGWHDRLVDVVEWLTGILDELPTITSTWRPGDKGVHGTDPLRAIDLRSRGYDAKKLTDIINDHWQYDSTRPGKKVAILHDVGRGNHIHIQVHDNTVIIKGGWGKTKI